MTDPASQPGLFALPPGADFPAALVAGFHARMTGQPPEASGRATIFLNTARMLRHVRDAFEGSTARFLPRLRLVTDIANDPVPGLVPATPPLRRRLELIRLVQALIAKEPGLAPDAAVTGLADSLAALMAEMQGEGVAPDRLELPDMAEDHAAHWDRSLTFLRIVAPFFGAAGQPDPDARQRRAVEALIERWATAPPDAPVIVAGSTGSRGTTALLMQAVARLPQGAVVLPGFDFDMPATAWDSLADGPVPGEDHPQFRFLRLCRSLGVAPGAVRPWLDAGPPDPARNRLVSLALRPAPMTDQWLSEGPGLGDLIQATDRMTLIEAPNAAAEAKAIAMRLREAVERGHRAALVTPDRGLTRRVAAALDRWGIVADDSAGEPLSQTAPGRFLLHVAGMAGQRLTGEVLLVLLKHPMTASGSGDRGTHLRLTRELELRLRRRGPAFPTADDVLAWSQKDEAGDRAEWGLWLAGSLTRLQGVSTASVLAGTDTILAIAEAVAAGPSGGPHRLWQGEAGILALRMMTDLRREADAGGDMAPPAFADFLTAYLGGVTVRDSVTSDPRIAIWGTLEARVQGADLVILAGLNEGIWPAAPAPDPWMSRQMRIRAGLLLPERQIGLSAHDFQQAVAATEVVLSRALRDADAETVPSRWLARMTNLLRGLAETGGPEALAAMRRRGSHWTTLAREAEMPPDAAASTGTAPAGRRPSPRPPLAVRPRAFAVTQIKTLIRDPYAIYAGLILRLKRLDPLRAEPDPRLRGMVLHAILEAFIRDRPDLNDRETARAALMELAAAQLADSVHWPVERRFWLARMDAFADAFLEAEQIRAGAGVPLLIEDKRTLGLEGTAFVLTARPDRIDQRADGGLHIIDYKSGVLPNSKDVLREDRQLVLEGAMAERGAFTGTAAARVAALTYISISETAETRDIKLDDETLSTAWADLERLLQAYDRPETGYTARSKWLGLREQGDFDHLARFGEWQMHDAPSGGEVP